MKTIGQIILLSVLAFGLMSCSSSVLKSTKTLVPTNTSLPTLTSTPPLTSTPQRTRETEEFLIYSLLIKEACKEKMEWTLPPTYILGETYYDPGSEDKYISWKEPSISQETLDNYRAISQEKQILDPTLISGNESCEFISSDNLNVALKEDDNWFNTHMLISFSKIGFSKNFDQAIVYRQYDCGGECAGNDLYILVRKDYVWSIKIILGGWRS